MRKKEKLPFATTWMDPEGIMLHEIRRTEKDKCNKISLTCRVQKSQSYRNESRMVVIRGLGVGKMRRCKWYKLPARRYVLRN